MSNSLNLDQACATCLQRLSAWDIKIKAVERGTIPLNIFDKDFNYECCGNKHKNS